MMNDSGNGRWRVLSSQYLIRKPWLTARVDKLELPDGRIMPEYYVLEYPDWVNVIAMTKDGKFVMERQYRHAAGITAYELPCCVIEKGESPLEAAKRAHRDAQFPLDLANARALGKRFVEKAKTHI